MGVAAHLGIDLVEYDARIRTFIPDYDLMLDVAARAIPHRARTIVDLGIGTGALAARCRAHASDAHVVGIDSDGEILRMAAERIPTAATFVRGSFLRTRLPPADAVVASFALHHVRTRAAKARLYQRIRSSLGASGVFISVDCHPSADPAAARNERQGWTTHLLRAYSRREANALLEAWSAEDVYVPLASEIRLIEGAGFKVTVLWRRGPFAVLRGNIL